MREGLPALRHLSTPARPEEQGWILGVPLLCPARRERRHAEPGTVLMGTGIEQDPLHGIPDIARRASDRTGPRTAAVDGIGIAVRTVLSA